MGLEGSQESIDAAEEPIVDDPLILVGLDFVLPLKALLMDLVLLCTNKGTFVYVWVDLNIGVVTQLEGILIVVSLEVQPGDDGEGEMVYGSPILDI